MNSSLLNGWNTFYTRSVLSWLKMPEQAAVSLSFKKLQQRCGTA